LNNNILNEYDQCDLCITGDKMYYGARPVPEE